MRVEDHRLCDWREGTKWKITFLIRDTTKENKTKVALPVASHVSGNMSLKRPSAPTTVLCLNHGDLEQVLLFLPSALCHVIATIGPSREKDPCSLASLRNRTLDDVLLKGKRLK